MKLEHRGTYPAHWPQLAEAVKKAAGGRCIRCGHNHSVRARRVLTVHHLDGDKANDAWWNLLALCQVCHLQIQGKVNPELPYLWEHSEWFKPYVAGYYASLSGMTPTRQEVEGDLEEFLLLGQPWRAKTSGRGEGET